jgi:hypothetical protein
LAPLLWDFEEIAYHGRNMRQRYMVEENHLPLWWEAKIKRGRDQAPIILFTSMPSIT